MGKGVLKKFINRYKQTVIASSIVEVIVASTICMIIFILSMSVILQSQKSNNIRLKQKAQFILSDIELLKIKKDSMMEDGSLRIEKTTQKNDTLERMNKITFSVLDNSGHRIGQKVVWIKTNQWSKSQEN